MEVSASHIHARYPTHATQDPLHGHIRFVYGTFTLYGAPFQVDFHFTNLGNRRSEPHISPRFPKGIRFVLFRFHSPLLTEFLLISFPPPTEMLQFGGFPFLRKIRGMTVVRRSNSAIRGSKRFMPLPATYRSLSRPSSALEPSHPPIGL